ncbi:RICIN domain-containing protein [Spirillospora sp. NPDC048911]|uniref:RICIN domain-containing protein n=1 Tax=Spirillospora sp. NPDC048911 TaxID=3364527 RepID=UPI0037148424
MRSEPGHRSAAPAVRVMALLTAVLVTLAGCGGDGPRPAAARKSPTPTAPAPVAAAEFVTRPERPLDERQAMYPRTIRLDDGRILVSVSGSAQGGLTDLARFYESTDDGATFRQLSEIRDDQAAGGRGGCCGSLLELPQQVGSQPAGTLLWAWTVGMKNNAPGRRPDLRVWRSTDGGRTWGLLSSCASAPPGTPADQGLWEPELALDAQNRLVCYFSDETSPGHEQTIAQVVSTDGGATWGAKKDVIALGGGARPGMPVVRRTPNGAYFMAYEVCGREQDSCEVHYRTSPDGSDWGDPRDVGTAVRTVDGKYLYHAPTITWMPGGGPDGRLLLVGGLLRFENGKLARPASGSTVLVNIDNGRGRWYEQTSPVRVGFSARPDHDEVVCDNYSSTLLPVADGNGILEVATERAGNDTCRAFVGTAAVKPAAPVPPKPGAYRLRNAGSGLCLDATGPGETVRQLPCDTRRPRQKWTVSSASDGSLKLRNARTGRCLGGGPCATWSVNQVTGMIYTVVAKTTGDCVDVTDGSHATGAVVQQAPCTGRAAQLWRLEPR